ncbi:MAG: hypothetical protein ACKVP7_01115 [Hyphomicrobiaceae bacterium]
MAIGVYRIYLGSTWADEAAVQKLVRGFDAIPGFLYRLDRLPRDTWTETSTDAAARRALVRIAMTQSHAVLMLRGAPASQAEDVAIELDLARNGFRRRLPIVEIAADANARTAPSTSAPDLVVGWEPADIACAIQQVAEQANADWRARSFAQAPPRQTPPPGPQPTPTVGETKAPVGGLPLAEITQAFEQRRQRRNDQRDGEPVR